MDLTQRDSDRPEPKMKRHIRDMFLKRCEKEFFGGPRGPFGGDSNMEMRVQVPKDNASRDRITNRSTIRCLCKNPTEKGKTFFDKEPVEMEKFATRTEPSPYYGDLVRTFPTLQTVLAADNTRFGVTSA
jgi:hypothetical protein